MEAPPAAAEARVNGIGVGELLRVWHALGATDDATRRAVRDVLLPAFDWHAPTERREEQPEEQPEEESTSERDKTEVTDAHTSADDVPFTTMPIAAEEQPLRPLELPVGPRLAADRNLAVEPEPLLEPVWSRRVVGELLAIDAPLGDLDIRRLVRTIAALRPLRRLPRKLRPTLRLGAQVLLDRHASLMVFFSDQSALRHELEGFAGRERTTVLRCDGFPPTEVAPLVGTAWRPYTPPPAGTPVLVVGDLGMARGRFPLDPAAEAAWDAFLAPLAAAGSRVSALVPCPPDRYPAFVHERMHLLLWDRKTQPSDARRARRTRR